MPQHFHIGLRRLIQRETERVRENQTFALYLIFDGSAPIRRHSPTRRYSMFPRPLPEASLTIWPISGIHVLLLLYMLPVSFGGSPRARALPREAVETCSCDVKKRHLVGSRWLAWGGGLSASSERVPEGSPCIQNQ